MHERNVEGEGESLWECIKVEVAEEVEEEEE